MSSNNSEFWHFLILGRKNDKEGVFANFYTTGSHCGEALAVAMKAAEAEGLIGPEVSEAYRLDNQNEYKEPGNLKKLDEGVFMLPELHSYVLEESDPEFILPPGILKSTDDSDQDFELIKNAFVSFRKDEQEIYMISLVAEKSRLQDTFFQAIDFMPDIDSVSLYIWNHWESKEKHELWMSGNLSGKEPVRKFLKANSISILENGFVDCVLQHTDGNSQCSLTLDQHKRICLQTNNLDLFEKAVVKFKKMGFSETKELHTIGDNYYHWHYRPVGSLDRKAFTQFLLQERFSLADSWD